MILFCEAFISPGAITEPREQYFPKETLLNNIFEKGISTMGQQSLQETITQRAPAGDLVPKPARGAWGAGFARFSLTDSSSTFLPDGAKEGFQRNRPPGFSVGFCGCLGPESAVVPRGWLALHRGGSGTSTQVPGVSRCRRLRKEWEPNALSQRFLWAPDWRAAVEIRAAFLRM